MVAEAVQGPLGRTLQPELTPPSFASMLGQVAEVDFVSLMEAVVELSSGQACCYMLLLGSAEYRSA